MPAMQLREYLQIALLLLGALGAQAAGLIEDVAENGWQVPARHFLLPVAVEKILHVDLARTHSSIRDEKLHEVDRVVGGGERKEP